MRSIYQEWNAFCLVFQIASLAKQLLCRAWPHGEREKNTNFNDHLHDLLW